MAPGRLDTGGPAVGESSTSDTVGNARRKSSARDNDPGMRRTSTAGPAGPAGPAGLDMSPEDRRRRRSSTFSAFNLSEASRDFQDEIVDPGPAVKREEITWKSWLPIMFAVIPPTAGLIFANGTAFFSDLTLLGLATIFLHWSISAPWKWYHSAQRVREDHQAAAEEALDIEDDELPTQPLSDSDSPGSASPSAAEKHERARQVDDAQARLRNLERAALATCFLAPAASTYLLYIVRDFLSRPSEGLVSNFNLGIFIMAAEVSPVSHAIKLILAKTLHLQQIIHSNPYRMVRITPSKYRDMLFRLEDLETRVLAQPNKEGCEGCECNNPQRQQQMARQLRDDVTRDVHTAIRPEIDSVIRAVRRYEKKTSTLTNDTEQRLRDLRRRLDDAIALSAVVARNSAGSGSLIGRVAGGGWYVVTFPMTATIYAVSLVLAPFTMPLDWLVRGGRRLIAQGDVGAQNLPGELGQGRIVSAASSRSASR